MSQCDTDSRLSVTEKYESQRQDLIAARSREIADELARLRNEARIRSADPDWYRSVARLLAESGDKEGSLKALRDGIAACPAAAGLCWQLAKTLHRYGETEAACAVAGSAVLDVPQGLQFRFFERLITPAIYESEEEITAWRLRFIQGLEACEKDVLSAGPGEMRAYLEGFQHALNFDLAYQGYDDLALQSRYGNLVRHIMRAQYPEWTASMRMPELPTDRRIRVGFISSHFYESTVARQFIGWLENLDRNRFEIHSYYTGTPHDSMTRRARDCSDTFAHIAGDFERMAGRIRQDRLHIGIFITAAKVTALAALRLAPVQCTAIGHPLTSGLPAMDYFLSSELMEPPGAQRNYSEQLILLPGIGICIERPPLPRPLLTRGRQAWGIPDDAVVYLCCQSLVKYLPRHDHIFPAIAERIPNAKFVFLAGSGIPVEKFRGRLERAFCAAGLKYEDYCLLLPPQTQFEYWNLNLVSDVFLDSFCWSGNMTTLDAIACGLPIVTLPGDLMRGRHAYAILSQLGIRETIASDEADYIQIAERLGRDTPYRKALAARVSAASAAVFSDQRSVRALAEFLERTVVERITADELPE